MEIQNKERVSKSIGIDFCASYWPENGCDGAPLSANIRGDMESWFGASFSTVRVHIDKAPAILGVAAFAWGEHLYFAPGVFAPETPRGRAILIHELTHVLQQRARRAVNPRGRGVMVLDDPQLEAEADAAVAGVIDPGLAAATAPAPREGGVIQCIHYRNLAMVDQRYQNEEGASSQFRAPTNGLIIRKERDLKLRLVQLAQLQSLLRTQTRGIGKLTRRNAIGEVRQQISKAERDISERRAFFDLQGFKLNPDGSIDWQASTSTVAYDNTEAATGNSRLMCSGGKLMWANVGFEASTMKMTTFFKGVGYGIYVMSERGNIHLHGHSIGSYHHSSLLKGGAVAGAGEMQIDDNGNLRYINNKSGHYKPSPVHLSQVIHQLRRMGVRNNFTVAEYAGGSFKEMTAATFLAREDADHDIELIRLLDYSIHFADPKIAGTLGMKWKSNPEPGFYSISTGIRLDHKIARKKLKAQGFKANNTYFSGGQQVTIRPSSPQPAVMPTSHVYHVLQSPPASPYETPVSSRSNSPLGAVGGGPVYHTLEGPGEGSGGGHAYHTLEEPTYQALEDATLTLPPVYQND